MNSKRQSDSAVTTTMRDRIAEWRQLLEHCGSKPTRKRVHALRVITLRLQAEFEHDLADLPHASHQAQAILGFGRQAEKLRRALGPVRELDVWMGKLRALRASLSHTSDYVPRSTYECVRGIERLEDRLKRKRGSAEKKLASEIAKRDERLAKAGEQIESALAEYIFAEEPGIAAELATRFQAVRAEFPSLDEENLHEFRKRIKTVRYLAEMRAPTNHACAQIAAQMKKLQSAIGEWHDWQALVDEARRGKPAKNKPLAELLESLTAESFESALSTVDTVTARLSGAGEGRAELLLPATRKPPKRSGDGVSAVADQKLA